MKNPVGTGPYKLGSWVRSSKIVLEAEPRLPRVRLGLQGRRRSGRPHLVKEMKGKKMPQVGRIEISIIEEDQARLLAFQSGELDIMNMRGPARAERARPRQAAPEFAKQGRQALALRRSGDHLPLLEPAGPGRRRPPKEKIALRRAMAMAYNVDEEITVVRNGQAVEAHFPIPPGVVGHDPKLQVQRQATIRPARNALLDRFGYRRGPTATASCPTASRS